MISSPLTTAETLIAIITFEGGVINIAMSFTVVEMLFQSALAGKIATARIAVISHLQSLKSDEARTLKQQTDDVVGCPMV